MNCTLKIGDTIITIPPGIPCGGGPLLFHIIQTGVAFMFLAAVILSLAYILIGGVKWVTSAGDKQKLQNARMTLTHAIIGLLLVFFSFVIIQLLGKFFGVDLLNISLP